MGKTNKVANYSEQVEESKIPEKSLPSINQHRNQLSFNPDLDPNESANVKKKPPKPEQKTIMHDGFDSNRDDKLSDVKIKQKALSNFEVDSNEQNSECDLMHPEPRHDLGEQAKEEIKRVFDYIDQNHNQNDEQAKHPDDDDNVLLTDRKDSEEEK